MELIIPKDYDPRLSIRETQDAIKYIRDTFQKEMGREMHLERISAPLFVEKSSGLNDNLNGTERPVSFDMLGLPGETLEVVHSLAKWKRMALKKYGFKPGEGLYTNMNAIRRDEELDNLHSCYVDQWDWERVITKEQRTLDTLKDTVREIFKIIKHMQHEVWYKYPEAVKHLPKDIYFITSQELEDLYPDNTPKERENLITREHGCVFLMQIGDKLAGGKPHDGRAPDYDDWKLNGDILFWFEHLQCALEISSMGIRVDEAALEYQLKKAGCEDRRSLPYHKMLLNGQLPYTIGGGIGQSRLCMLLLDRAHIGEVQASIWPQKCAISAGRTRFICCSHWLGAYYGIEYLNLFYHRNNRYRGLCVLRCPGSHQAASGSAGRGGSWRHHCCRRRYAQGHPTGYRPAQPVHEPCLRVHRLSHSHGALHPGVAEPADTGKPVYLGL